MTTSHALGNKILPDFKANPPADVEVIRSVEHEAGFSFPKDYAAFLTRANGGVGFIGDAYLSLWRVEDLIAANRGYEVERDAPGLFLVGSDGGGEAFAIDLRSEPCAFVSVPFIGMELSVVRPMGASFVASLETLARS